MEATTQITFSNDVRLTPTGLELRPGLSYEEWLSAMGKLYELEKMTWWFIGDGLAYGEMHYGERYAQATALAEATGLNVDSIRAAQWVSEKVPVVRRRTNLSWSHHRVVSAQEPDVQERLLAAAEEGEWSVSRLKEAVRTYKRALERPDEFPDEDDDAPDLRLMPDDEDDHPEYGTAEEAEPEIDPVAEWERAEAELATAREQIESLSQDDTKAELRKLQQRLAGVEGRLRGETNAKNEAVRLTKYYQRLVGDLKDALGVEDNNQIKPKILELLQRS